MIQTQPNPADAEDFRRRVAKLLASDAPAYRRMWDYYRNPATAAADASPSDEAGAVGPALPPSAGVGPARPHHRPARRRAASPGVARKEVVVENDIGWRIDTQASTTSSAGRSCSTLPRPTPTGGGSLANCCGWSWRPTAGCGSCSSSRLLGGVYGFVDVLVKLNPPADQSTGQPADASRGASVCDTQSLGQPPLGSALSLPVGGGRTLFNLACLAGRIRLEVVEPQRALPLLNPDDASRVDAYAQVYELIAKSPERPGPPPALRVGILSRLLPAKVSAPVAEDRTVVVDLLTPTAWRRYEGERLVAAGENALGVLPLVHVQNVATPFDYAGVGDVEPLMPLQDELNTRLSDRAYRLALQSFKMYLGKGVEDFLDSPVAPGRMWTTDNPDAQLIEFGGDASCPSEEAHLADLREAMDKVSGVSPIAAGAIKGRVGRLTSAAALRVTMLALLARTERKRHAYGGAIGRICELSLAWLDRAGLFATTPDERRVEIHWPDPVPADAMEKLDEARAKRDLGVPQEVVLRELGY